MKNRRYVLVIMDSSGRSVRRLGFSRRSLEAVVIGAWLAALAGFGAFTHGLMRHDRSQEAQQIARENAELARLVSQIEGRLPAARAMSLRAELTFAQLWAKSGLGVEPRLLGVGPVAADASSDQSAAASYNGALLNADAITLPLELERIESDGRLLQRSLGETLEYFHDAERLLSNTPSLRPARTPWLTSSFGKRRDPIHRRWVMHKGLDMGGYTGMEIISPADGVIIWTGRRGGYGQTVVIDHGYGLQTHFAHLSRYLVKLGDRVRRGDPIAEMGSTGKSTGPHLHYEVRRNGQPLDPRRFILD